MHAPNAEYFVFLRFRIGLSPIILTMLFYFVIIKIIIIIPPDLCVSNADSNITIERYWTLYTLLSYVFVLDCHQLLIMLFYFVIINNSFYSVTYMR